MSLLTLRLHAPLRYHGLENPPFAGLGPKSPAALVPGSAPGPEGQEELFVFDESDLVVFDPDDGPLAAPTLPPPRFYGQALATKSPPPGESENALPAGDYLFLQWRPADEAEVRAGIEFFAREAWWEGHRAVGPYLLRRVVEDGKVATQLLRSLAAPES